MENIKMYTELTNKNICKEGDISNVNIYKKIENTLNSYKTYAQQYITFD